MKRVLSVIAICIVLAMTVFLAGCSATPEKNEETTAAVQTYAQRLQSCKEQIEAKIDFKPDVVLVLGTGLGDFADTIGMSTGAEVIAARHMGMKVCVINAVSNMAAGMEEDGFDQDLIEENMTHSAENFKTLINGLLDFLSK